MPNETMALAARLGSAQRRATSLKLYADTTLRKITLGPGGWRLYGHATQVYFVTRAAKADGSVADGEQAAPSAALAAPTNTGAPTTGAAWASAQGAAGALTAPLDPTQWEEIAVPESSYRNLYISTASGTATPVLQGPYE